MVLFTFFALSWTSWLRVWRRLSFARNGGIIKANVTGDNLFGNSSALIRRGILIRDNVVFRGFRLNLHHPLFKDLPSPLFLVLRDNELVHFLLEGIISHRSVTINIL